MNPKPPPLADLDSPPKSKLPKLRPGHKAAILMMAPFYFLPIIGGMCGLSGNTIAFLACAGLIWWLVSFLFYRKKFRRTKQLHPKHQP